MRQPLQNDQPDSLREMVKFLSLHAPKVSEVECVALVAALLHASKTKANGQGHGDVAAEVQKLTIKALGYLVLDGKAALPGITLRDIAAYLCGLLAELVSDSRLSVDRATGHLLYGALRLLQAIILQVKSVQEMSLSILLDSLRKLCAYGTWPLASVAQSSTISSAAESPDRPSPSRPSAYRPPHARRRLSQNIAPTRPSDPNTRASNGSGSWRSEDGGYSSASDASESESDSAGGDPSRASHVRVRLAALSCLQALAKVDCKALHPFWVVLLPVHTPLARRPDSLTLMDAIVNDPAPKVRAAAAATLAALLEGAPQRAYLGIAECRSSANQPVRGFTTLSATLGKLALSLHDGLLQDAASEAHPAALTAVLRALHVLISSAPYARLPPTLLPRTLTDVHRCSARLQKGSRRAVEEAAAAQAAALSCIAAALNANASRGHLSELLLPGHSASADDAQPQGFGPRLADDLLQLCAGVSSAVKAEALSALQALAMGHRGLLKDHWDSLKSVMVSSLESGGEERCALNALRLLGSYLKVPADEARLDNTTVANARTPSDIPASKCNSSSAARAKQWRDALAMIIPKGEEHNVPAVRAAALTALASLDETARAALSSSQLQRLWGWLFDSAEIECNTAVRNAALKTAGTLAQLRCSLEYPGAAAMLGIFDAGLQDRWPTLSVQIAAAWALANLADTVTQSPTPAPELCSSIAHAALGAANAGDKVRANAVRAIGYIVAIGPQHRSAGTKQNEACSSAEVACSSSQGKLDAADAPVSCVQQQNFTNTPSAAEGLPGTHGQPDAHDRYVQRDRQQKSEAAHSSCREPDPDAEMSSGQPPDWFVRGLGCLHEALASGNGKVQWNACYAIGALLRSAAAAAAADACGGLQPLLAQLLDVLQHGANFKTRMHAAAALCAVKDGRLILQLQPDVVSRLKSALQGLDGSHDQGAESPGPPGQADWPVLGQESLQNLQSLYPLKEQLHATLQHIEELLKST